MSNTRTLTRPASLAEWLEREQARASFFTESTQHGLAYQPQLSDLFIAPHAKCGATWLQQIVHGLRTRGDMNFDDVSQVILFVETAYSMGLDLAAPQPGGFRAFKSHLSWTKIPKGGRYIVSFRDPKDALVAYYDFVNGYYWQTNSVSITEFARAFYFNYQSDDWERSYWGHLVSWWEQRHHRAVLLLTYEGMQADLSATAETIARFLGIELDQDLLNLVLKHASLACVLAHESNSADPLFQDVSAKQGCYPPSATLVKAKTGQVGAHRTELPAAIGAEMDTIWRETVESRTGLASYHALRVALG